MMPELLGFHLARQLKELCPNCKILLISGHPAAEALLNEQCGPDPGFQIFAKPMHPLDLLAEVRRLAVGAEA